MGDRENRRGREGEGGEELSALLASIPIAPDRLLGTFPPSPN